MTKEQIANVSVLITQILKQNTDKTAVEVRQMIVDQLADQLTADEIIMLLTGLFDDLGIEYEDVDDGLQTIQNTGKLTVKDVQRNILWQDVAQVFYYALYFAIYLVAPKPADVIRKVLSAYEVLKGGKR